MALLKTLFRLLSFLHKDLYNQLPFQIHLHNMFQESFQKQENEFCCENDHNGLVVCNKFSKNRN